MSAGTFVVLAVVVVTITTAGVAVHRWTVRRDERRRFRASLAARKRRERVDAAAEALDLARRDQSLRDAASGWDGLGTPPWGTS